MNTWRALPTYGGKAHARLCAASNSSASVGTARPFARNRSAMLPTGLSAIPAASAQRNAIQRGATHRAAGQPCKGAPSERAAAASVGAYPPRERASASAPASAPVPASTSTSAPTSASASSSASASASASVSAGAALGAGDVARVEGQVRGSNWNRTPRLSYGSLI